ncbi:MAG: hypothetical protein AAF827_14585 [Cyanobacteria bacterium P01_D01_bin.6]
MSKLDARTGSNDCLNLGLIPELEPSTIDLVNLLKLIKEETHHYSMVLSLCHTDMLKNAHDFVTADFANSTHYASHIARRMNELAYAVTVYQTECYKRGEAV